MSDLKSSMGGTGASDDPDTIVGLKEIAARLRVKPKTPQRWKARGLLPDPLAIPGGRPVWRWGVIENWAYETGRLP